MEECLPLFIFITILSVIKAIEFYFKANDLNEELENIKSKCDEYEKLASQWLILHKIIFNKEPMFYIHLKREKTEIIKHLINDIFNVFYENDKIQKEPKIIKKVHFDTTPEDIEKMYFEKIYQLKDELNNSCFNEIVLKNFIQSLNDIKQNENNSFFDKPSFKNDDGSINEQAISRSIISILRNFIADKLESGQLHIYRGVLDETGKELLHIYRVLSDKMIELKFINEDTGKVIDRKFIEIDFNILKDNIRQIG